MCISTSVREEKTVEKLAEIKGRSLWQDAWMRLKRNRAALVCIFLLSTILVLSIVVPEFGPNNHEDQNYELDPLPHPPTLEGNLYFGTDDLGRDLFSRIFYGIRVSLIVGFVASFASLMIGVAYGAIAGYFGKRTDMIMMRIVDIFYAIPFMFLFILIMVLFKDYIASLGHIFTLTVIIGLVEWFDMARIVRGQTLSVKEKEFVEAAHASGVKTRSIIFRHIVPNCLGPVIIYITLLIPKVILVETFLSFLGLGVPEPDTSLGKLISTGVNHMETEPWILLFPAIFLAIILFCFNFIGDGLRDALDPKDR